MSSIQTASATNTKPDFRELIKSYGLLCVQKEKLIGNPNVSPETIIRLDIALSQLEDTLAEPQSPDLDVDSDVWSYGDLEKIGITFSPSMPPHIIRKPGCEAAVARAAALASNDLWSSGNLIRQLNLVTNTSCIENETLVHGWVDAIFRRVMAMLPQDKHMTLHMETQLLPKIDPYRSRMAEVDYDGSGFMLYTVMLSRQYSDVVGLLKYDEERFKDQLPDNVLLVTAGYSKWIRTCIAQAVHNMYEFAVTMEKKIVRGAVTCGYQWIFLILTMNDDFEGGIYQESEKITVNAERNYPHSGPVITDDFNPHYITAILMNWVQNTFSDLDSDDLLLQKREWDTASENLND